jgi:hypothetical protein
MASNDEVAKILAMLAASYPRFQLTRETIAAYVQLLGDIPTHALKAAAMQCATSGTFFPSVHELRQAVADLQRNARGIPSAFEAWYDVSNGPKAETLKGLEEEGGKFYITTHTREWSHPLVERVAKLLGWPTEFPGDNPVADRAHFFKAYDSLLAEEMSSAVRHPAIQGYIDSEKKNLLEAKNG